MQAQSPLRYFAQSATIAFLTLSVFVAVSARTHAQDVVDLSEETVSPDTIFTNAVDVARQNELRTTYQSYVEDYTVKMREFDLARAQWRSFQTLRSLEEAVVATRRVLLVRDKTFIAYFELLYEIFDHTPGIELQSKKEIRAGLIANIEWLREHLAQTESATDRDAINLNSDTFTTEIGPRLLIANKALMLIRLGQLQTTFDRTNNLYQQIQARNKETPGSALQEVERTRAYTQVDVLRDDIEYELRLSRESLDAATAQQGRPVESYDSFVGSLESPYAKTAKYLSFLEELARDVW